MVEVYLDLHEVDLYGWEKRKSAEKIKEMLEGIANGSVFPAVPVFETTFGVLLLDPKVKFQNGFLDGGHHRAVAHYIAQVPLRCDINPAKTEYNMRWPKGRFIPIAEIRISSGRKVYSIPEFKNQVRGILNPSH